MHGTGCIFSKKDMRDYKLNKSNIKVKIPKEFKLEPPSVLDQGNVSSCVAHSTASTAESIYHDAFSTGWIYGNRNFDNFSKGMTISDALKTARQKGCVLRKEFNVNEEVLDIIDRVEQNRTRLEPLAEPYKIGAYARLDTAEDIKLALLKGIPVIFACTVKEDYLSMDENYVINITNDKIACGHAMIIYGWNETGWLIQNSWGEDWGNNGRAILPYEYPIEEAYAISKYVASKDAEIKKPKLYWLRELINTFIKLIERIMKWKKQDN